LEPLNKLLTQKEYADIRRCSVRTAERERESGDGCPYVRLGRRIYYRREDVERFISAHVRGIKQNTPRGRDQRHKACTTASATP
jgi:hypothetical protein